MKCPRVSFVDKTEQPRCPTCGLPCSQHFGADALSCYGATPADELTTFVGAFLTTDEIMDLGRRIAGRHGLNTFGPLDRRNTMSWFRTAIACAVLEADATRYLHELERRQHQGEPLVRALVVAG